MLKAGDSQATARLLERDAELARIESAIDAACGGAGGLLLIEGEPGIGKSSLLRVAREIAAARQMTTVGARAIELEREFAYGAVRQLLERHLRSLEPSKRADALDLAASAAAPLLGLAPAEIDATRDPSATLNGLYWVVSNVAASRPLLLTLDDAHWADADSLRFMAFLAPRLADIPVLSILAARPGEWQPAALFSSTASDAVGSVLSLGPLSAATTAGMVAQTLGAPASPDFAMACQHATGGNPFFLHALLAELEREHVDPATGAERVPDLGPRAVKQATAARLTRLTSAAQAVARAVAVLGDGTASELAAALAEVDRASVPEIVEQLARAALLDDGEPLRYAHPITRNAVYGEIGEAARERLHRRAVELLEHRGAAPERVAAHLLALRPARDPAVVATLRRAAADAAGQGAPASAIGHLRRALAEPPDAADRVGVLLELGMAEAMIDGDAAAARLHEALTLTDETAQRAEIAHTLQLTLLYLARPRDAIGVLREELARASAAGEDGIAARLEASLAVALAIGAGEGLGEADERLERIARAARDSARAEPLALACVAFRRLQRGAPRRRVVEPALLALARVADGDPAATAPVLVHAVGSLIRCDELDAADRWAGHALELARQTGSVLALALANWLLGGVARRRGQLDEAIARYQTALRQASEFGTPEGIASSLAGLVDAQVERGELDAAEAALHASSLLREPPVPSVAGAELLHARARLRLARGDVEHSLADFRLVTELFDPQGGGAPGPGNGPWRSSEGLALLRADQRRRALALTAEELDLARRLDTPSALGIALTAAGTVTGGERGVELLVEAVAVLERTPIRLEHARALVELGAALRREGSRSKARDLLGQGLEIARECGAMPLVERAYDELRATGARPRKVLATGAEALTPSERRVAQLAARGMTNREIAQELFLSVRTVEFHLGQCYRKLSIPSRRGLAQALARDG